MGAVASAGRPGQGWVRADPRQDPSSCLSGGPAVPLADSANQSWAGLWPRESVGGTVRGGTWLPGHGSRGLPRVGGLPGEGVGTRGQQSLHCCPGLPTTEAPPLPAQASRGVGAGRFERDRAAARGWEVGGGGVRGWDPPQDLAWCAHLGGAASSCAESLHLDKRPVPSPGPGPTLGNHRGRFSHGRCPLSGPHCHPIGPWEALPSPPHLEEPVLHAHPSAPRSPSTGRTNTEGLSYPPRGLATLAGPPAGPPCPLGLTA